MVEVEPASATLSELRMIQSFFTGKTRGLGIEADSVTRVSDNRVELRVRDRERLETALRRADVRLPDKVVVIDVLELAQPQADMYAGRPLYWSGYTSGHWCTSGFSVTNNSGLGEGALTSYHCSDGGELRLQFPRGNNLTRITGAYGQSWDVEWHRTPNYDDRPLVYTGSGLNQVLGLCGRNCVQEGYYLCNFGQTTGRDCGYVFSKDWELNTVPYPSPTWVGVYKKKPSEPLTSGGDSGGPWFAGSTAYGVHTAGAESEDFWFSYYMPINYASSLNVTVQTAN